MRVLIVSTNPLPAVPAGSTAEICRLMKDSGCFYVNLSVRTQKERR